MFCRPSCQFRVIAALPPPFPLLSFPFTPPSFFSPFPSLPFPCPPPPSFFPLDCLPLYSFFIVFFNFLFHSFQCVSSGSSALLFLSTFYVISTLCTLSPL